jgi:hypothetical protein
MTTLNGLVGIAFNVLAIVASTTLSSQQAVLIHQLDDRHRSDQPAAQQMPMSDQQPIHGPICTCLGRSLHEPLLSDSNHADRH